MLSILIPEYNHNCCILVNDLFTQCSNLKIDFEIIVLDDASKKFIEENSKISQYPYCRFVINTDNSGAAKTRNKLVSMAKFPNVLLIDCDAQIPDSKFIERYVKSIDKSDVIVGGLIYNQKKPKKDKILRWHYGRNRECIKPSVKNLQPYKSFSSFQFLTKKEVLINHPFDESIIDYGHEDTLIGYEFQNAGISIIYIDNPLIHTGLENNETFLDKSLVSASKYFTNPVFREEALFKSIKIFNVFRKICNLNLDKTGTLIFRLFSKSMKRNLLSPRPSLFIFDCYRLGYMCLYKQKNQLGFK
jgi:glycosyltransferase involved in cell wall biosynthesis